MKVLVTPLDWGLGHATRCVPIVESFLKAGAEVILGTCGNMNHFFKETFPDLKQVEMPSYGIEYPSRGYQMPAWLLSQLPRLYSIVEKEHETVESLVSSLGIQAVFSDNRFGAYSEKVPSIYMTHQLRIAFPFASRFLEGIGVRFHASRMSKYSEVWVPDIYEFPGFAGRLSHQKLNMPCRYIGPLSRFSDKCLEVHPEKKKKFQFLGMVSGVEPMRTNLERRLVQVLNQISGNHALLLGKPGLFVGNAKCGNVTLYPHLPKEEFRELVESSELFISRPGYSTVMDQAFLGANCLFVPTPGQTEQIYLGKILSKYKFAHVVEESRLDASLLKKLIQEPVRRMPFGSSELLDKAVVDFLRSHS